MPCTWAGLFAKARAWRDDKYDPDLPSNLMWDIGVLAGEVKPDEVAGD
jgi:hypothetical protein